MLRLGERHKNRNKPKNTLTNKHNEAMLLERHNQGHIYPEEKK